MTLTARIVYRLRLYLRDLFWQPIASWWWRTQFVVSCFWQGVELTLGRNVRFYHPVKVHGRFGKGGKLKVEDGVQFAFKGGAYWLGPIGFELRTRDAELVIGSGTTIMRAARIICFNCIAIGRECSIGDNCLLLDSNGHDFSPGGYDKLDPGAPISLGDRVHIGPDVTVLKGVTIGNESLVGTRSVVVGNLPARCVAIGNPARVLHQYAAKPAEAPKPVA